MKKNIKVKPAIRWAGGKRSLLTQISKRLPSHIKNYYEPFFGGGAVFFHIHNNINKAYLSDINSNLMQVYKAIQKDPYHIIAVLRLHNNDLDKTTFKDYYNEIRRDYNNINTSKATHFKSWQPARFLFLNHTCFNALYRENQKGEFNVPCGSRRKFPFNRAYYENLLNINNILKNATLDHGDFETILTKKFPTPKKDDFIYIDPPYHKSFTKYNKNDFKEEDQIRLAHLYKKLDKKGVNIMLNNSFSEDGFFQELYDGFDIERVDNRKCINPNTDSKTKELIITNYKKGGLPLQYQ